MTINALVTKLYPNGNKIFHEITAAKVVSQKIFKRGRCLSCVMSLFQQSVFTVTLSLSA